MYIEEISLQEFENFASNHYIGNYHESVKYALLKAEEGYEYEFIAYRSQEIKAVALILSKRIGNYYYGYSPRGFLIDYTNYYLLNDFTKKLIAYYKKKKYAFIKINPEIAISKLNKNTHNFEYNENYKIIDNLKMCGYKKLKDNMNFESLLPRVNAIVNLKEFNETSISKNTRNKIRKGYRKGLVLTEADSSKINILYEFIKNKKDKKQYYYNNLYNVFKKSNDIDLLLVKVDYKEYLINSQYCYNKELIRNNYLNERLITNNNASTINAKMNSDKNLTSYKEDIAQASKELNSNKETYVAGALVIKFQNRIIIEISGYDKKMSSFSPNYFLYYAILMHYKKTYQYADLNGITADLSHENKYYGLNRFKLGFNPDIYEYIGEFDLLINEKAYNHLLDSGLLAKEFNK